MAMVIGGGDEVATGGSGACGVCLESDGVVYPERAGLQRIKVGHNRHD